MKKYILGFVSILLLVAVSGCFKGGGERIQKKLSKELSLNDSQKKTLLSSFEELQKLQTQSQEILNSMRDSIAAEVGKENFSTNSISKNIQSQIDKLNKMILQKLGELATKFKEKESNIVGRKHDKNKHDKDDKGG